MGQYRLATMGGQVRITLQTLQVLRVLLDRPTGQHYGLEISRNARLPTGSIYPILIRLEAAGWVTSEWEEIDEAAEGRRRRRYYRLTTDGAEWARHEVEKTQQSLFPPSDGPRAPFGPPYSGGGSV
jgi:DNA-binding PadR family transcriptional regulator